MAATPFCGRCGYPVTPGAPFCGRCGAPQGVLPAATYPVYTYPVAPPGTLIGGIKLTHVVLAGGLLLILLVATLVVSVLTVSTITGSRAPCRADCGPKLYVPLAAANTYRSQAYKFEVDYSSNWSVRSQNDAGISLGTRFGHMDITGMKTGKSPDQVISDVVSNLPSSVNS